MARKKNTRKRKPAPRTSSSNRSSAPPRTAPGKDAGCALWALRDLISTLLPLKGGRGSASTSASTRHLRNAGVEALEALRAVLDETIEWLREERGSGSKLRRIRVDG